MTSFVLLDCDVFWSPRLWCFPIFKIFIFYLTDRNVLQRMVLSLLLQRLQACWADGDHDIQVMPMVMIMNAIMIHRWACRCFSSVIVFHIEPRMLAQDLMRFGIIYFIFLMGFGQVSFFTKGFSQTNSILLPRLTTSSSWVTQWVWSLLSIKYQRKKIMPKSLVWMTE